jgi:hypothetical protein
VISFLREIEGLRFFEALDALEGLALRDEGQRQDNQ